MSKDQLGPINDISFYNAFGSWATARDPADGGMVPRYAAVHARNFDGEEVLVVDAEPGADLGDTALYAAFLYHTTNMPVRCHTHGLEQPVNPVLEQIVPPYMSDEEIEERFAHLRGTQRLDKEERIEIARTALLIQTHFTMLLAAKDEAEHSGRNFEEEI